MIETVARLPRIRRRGVVAALLAVGVGAGAVTLLHSFRASRSRTVLYDLSDRLAVADRQSPREVLLFGTPAAWPHLVEGFYFETIPNDQEGFSWAKPDADISFTWKDVKPREALLDVAPYEKVRDQAVEIHLNQVVVSRFGLNDRRFRYRFSLPVAAQLSGENRFHFVFARKGSPAESDPASKDRRQLAAAFYSLTIGEAGDPGLDDLLAREAPPPFSATTSGGQRAVVQLGPSVVGYAVRLPAGAELRFAPEAHRLARNAGARVLFRVTIEHLQGGQRELWAREIGPNDPPLGEVGLSLPGAAGTIARIGFHVSGPRSAWGAWRRPRLLGRGLGSPRAPVPPSRGQERRAEAIRQAVAHDNVLFILLDGARAQQFSCYGYQRPTTPEIDRIASEGVRFKSAYTPGVYTIAAMSSIWTSQYPDRHHSEVDPAAHLPKDRLTLAEVLSAQGIHTAAFVANAVAGNTWGFGRGFIEFNETHLSHGSGGGAFRSILPGWFAAHRDRRFFAYIHFREPHFPYAPPPPFDTRFGPDGPIPKEVRRVWDWFTAVNQGKRAFSPAEQDHLVRLYDGNLAFADQEVGAILRGLKQAGLSERTVVIITGDHGTELREHGWIGHNVHVFEEATHVPLIIRFPTGHGPQGLAVAGLADHTDLAPTITDIMGVFGKGGSDKQFEGRSLLPVVAGAPGKTVVLSRTIWERPIYALRDDAFKLIYDTRTGEEHLFDLRSDPLERQDQRDQQPLRADFYRQMLQEWVHELGQRRPTSAGPNAVLTRQQCEEMKALGYLASDFACPGK